MTRRRQHSSRIRIIRLAAAAAILIIIAAVSYGRNSADTTIGHEPEKQVEIVTADQLLYVITPDSIPCNLINYTGMNIGFNPRLHVPNWVAWELTAEETLGKEPRHNKFFADDDVAGSAEPYDYSYSGYDRGHMAPAADMKWDKKAIRESHFMTNIAPQVKALNSGSWKRLEDKCRTWARADSCIYIVCGPIVTDKAVDYIGDSRVYVPQRYFKVILSLYGDKPRGIGFIMPNGKVPGGMQAAAVTIDQVEKATGYDFFEALPDEIENDVESQCDFHRWSTIRDKK